MSATIVPNDQLVIKNPETTRRLVLDVTVGVAVRGQALQLGGVSGQLEKLVTPNEGYAILSEDVDVTGGDAPAEVYVSGVFTGTEIVLGAGVWQDFWDGFRKNSILLKSSINKAV